MNMSFSSDKDKIITVFKWYGCSGMPQQISSCDKFVIIN